MKRILKKTISVLIASILLLLSASGAIAAMPIDSTSYLAQDQLYLHLYEAVYLELERQASVFFNLDSSKISFGRPLNTYYYSENVIDTTEAIYIPIFYENTLFSLALMIYSDNTLIGVELSSELVEPLNEYINCEICVIFDKDNTYISNGAELLLIQSNISSVESIAPAQDIISASSSNLTAISESTAFTETNTSKLSAHYAFGSFMQQYNSRIMSPQNVATTASNAYPSSYQLDFTIVPQNGYPICWAAAVAGIGLQQTGISHTAEYVSNHIYGQLCGGNTYMALFALQDIYGISGIDKYYAPYFSEIKWLLYDEQNSIFVRVYYGSNTPSHALVIYGYTDFEVHTYDGLLLVADSNFTTGKVIYFMNDRSYPYTLNGITGYIDEFILLY